MSAPVAAEELVELHERILPEVRALVEETRATCLWFLGEDFAPTDVAQAERALRWIEQHGDRDAFAKARRLREWLSRTSSGRSADSSPRAG